MRQHLVSRVLLRRFENHRNSPICVFDLDGKVEKTSRVKHICHIQDFILVGAKETEGTWQTVEKRLPYAFELLDKKEILNDSAALDTFKDCIALHWARSIAVEEMYKKKSEIYANMLAENVLNKASPEEVLRALTGLDVLGPQAPTIAHERLRDYFRRATDKTKFKAKLFYKLFDRARSYVSEFALEFGIATEGELMLADTPVIAWNSSTRRVGPLQGVRWGQADVIFMALGPKHVVALTQHNTYRYIGEKEIERLNALQLQGALRYMYYRCGSSLGQKLRQML